MGYKKDYIISSNEETQNQFANVLNIPAPFVFSVKGPRSLRNSQAPYISFIDRNRFNNRSETFFPFGKYAPIAAIAAAATGSCGETLALSACPTSGAWSSTAKRGIYSLAFDGTSSLARLGDTVNYIDWTAFADRPNGGFTISMWINPGDTDGAKYHPLISQWNELGGYRTIAISSYTLQSSGTIVYRADTAGNNTYNAGNAQEFGMPMATTIGVWNHLVFVWDGQFNTFYWNGALASFVDRATDSITGLASSSYLGFCEKLQGVEDVHYNGLMDEIAIYGMPFSASDVSSLYNSGNGISAGDVNGHTLAYYWTFENNGPGSNIFTTNLCAQSSSFTGSFNMAPGTAC